MARQWEQRVEVMRDSMIYFRNSPSIFFWEAGNTVVTAEQMRRWWPCASNRPRRRAVMGTRGNSNGAANTALTPVSDTTA